MKEYSDKSLKISRLLYIFEAAIEYWISLLVAGSYLATLTKELGFSDMLTGILSSVISLGCLFQLLSLTMRRTQVKKFVVVLSIINQVMFMLLYVIPLTNFPKEIKIIIFIILIFSAFLIYNFAHPKKINWLMSLVEDGCRGIFTANKEIISLLSGMVFSFGMGTLIDYFAELGKIKIAFVLSGGVIFVLMLLHSLTMIFTVEKKMPQRKAENFKSTIHSLLRNRNVLQVTIVFILYYISNYISTPFYGTYQIGELGMNLKFVTLIAMFGSISRVTFSKFWGRYADKKSFAVMIEKCFFFLALSQVCVIFSVPTTGRVLFLLYYILNGIALGGINSALINLIFEYVSVESRADSLAITQALAGVIGFITTLCISPVVSHIQKNGNYIFIIPIYAQQFVTIIALIFSVLAIIYMRCVFIKNPHCMKKSK